MSYRVRIESQAFDPWRAVANEQRSVPAGASGACSTFVGTVRGQRDSGDVQRLVVEHYAGMTERVIEQQCADAEQRWGTQHILVAHRVGEMCPGDPIVLIAVWAEHRAAAFDACRVLITQLKSNAPFWKREHYAQGTRWVETNTADPGSLSK